MKQTEIGLIPEDWEVKELGELGEVKMCKRVFQNQTSEIGEIPFYKIGTFGKEPDAYISRIHFEDFKNRFSYPKVGEILISAAGTIGRTVVYNGEESYFQDSNIVWIANKEEIVSNALLKYILEEIKYNTEGGTIQRLYNNILKSTKFICPPLAEQEAIANALSDADAWIEKLEQLIAKKRLIKQGAMQTLLTPKDGWEEVDFNKVVWFQEGPGLRNWQFTKSGIKVINVTNLENGYLNLSKTSRHISIEEYERMYKHFLIDEGDVVVASSGNSYGKVAIVRSQDLPLLMNTSVIRFKPLNGITYLYMLVFLKSNLFKDQIDLLITGGAQPNFGPAHLNKLKIAMPKSLSEQERIATILSDMDTEIEGLEQQLGKARHIKQGMMQELLTGRIRLV
ncbi:type I restriction enzyme S subunit [Moheibacter stercoris]|uniref:Type I restriction enzyme S subunit n=2 Tax=Moheibacter stercoris TaxID=1628251 RepID=A0ABV2LRV2_9FLAO